ncbi:hypothetical protein H5410_044239 [Solanum commersonii]|uniref:Uncharacterized protein n=1 Tax=Solanum commersonii TaxID=4109 RepID=A0A9J5X8J2_SOLCO|nr:hypothetical protein H5410_044239 [Solanum commersonii]
MEGTKKTSSCSFTSDLFGSKETSASSSSSIFGSIFPPPSKGHGSMNSEQLKHDPVIQDRNAKGGDSGSTPTSNEASSQQAGQNKQPSSFYQNEKVQPCHLSSSIYYGGQDVYSFPQNNNQSSTYTTNVEEAWILDAEAVIEEIDDRFLLPTDMRETSQFNKDNGEDDSGSASRGNWWQGSLYY